MRELADWFNAIIFATAGIDDLLPARDDQITEW